ncbi:MAG: homoserine dehydrogenase [Elusimicrobia bacterium]|nr:homoserine dehydrogenase [Elusimicrobiota bacterium]
MKRRPVSIALCGLGTVGRETARLLMAGRSRFRRRLGAELRLACVCDRDAVREARTLGLPASVRRSKDWRQALADPAVDLVVELFGGYEEAGRLVLAALAAGKGVVTANKLLLSRRWDALAAAAERKGAPLHFEAAVAGGVPIIRTLRAGLAADRVDEVHGILNGTTNFILSAMAHSGATRTDAVREAQRLGYAEKDPTLDLNGTDAAHKVSILASLLAGRWLPPAAVPRDGIEAVDTADIAWAVAELKRTVRLVGTAIVRGRGETPAVEAHVRPTLVPLLHPLAGVHGGNNALLVRAASAGELMFYGPGAGAGPTASAVLADVLAAAGGILGGPDNPGQEGMLEASGGRPCRAVAEAPAPHYLRFSVRDVPGALARIAGVLGKLGVSIARIHQDDPPGGARSVPVHIVTHTAERAVIDKARRAVTALSPGEVSHACLRLWPA